MSTREDSGRQRIRNICTTRVDSGRQRIRKICTTWVDSGRQRICKICTISRTPFVFISKLNNAKLYQP